MQERGKDNDVCKRDTLRDEEGAGQQVRVQKSQRCEKVRLRALNVLE